MPEITDSCTGEVIKGALITVEVDVLRDRLRRAYAIGLRHIHDGGRVEIHLGDLVVAYLKDLEPVEDPLALASGILGNINPTCWGYPVIPAAETMPSDHIAVHVVHDIL